MADAATMILSYEVKDDPCNEHEVEVESVDQARKHLAGLSDMVVWATLTDAQGETVEVDLI